MPVSVYVMSLIAVEERAVEQGESQPPRAADIAAAFLLAYTGRTRNAYETDLRDCFEFCIAINIDPLEVRRAHVDGWARKLDEIDGRAPSTVGRKLSAVSGFYRYATDEEVIGRNPVSAVRRPKVGSDTQSTGLDRDELGALIEAASAHSPRTNALILVLAMNGLRVSEALGADVTDLDTERGHQVLRITRKGGKRATAPLAPRTTEAVDAYLNGRTNGPLFCTSTGARLDSTAVRRLLRRLAASAVTAKARTIRPHDFRHAFVTLSLDAGVSLSDVQDAAGHADPRTTRRYDRARYSLDRHPTYALAGFMD